MDNISVILADSQYLIRVGLRHILQGNPSYKIVSEVTNEKQLMNELSNGIPDVVIIDYNQPGAFSTNTVDQVKRIYPKAKILVISDDEDKNTVLGVLENGVNSFLSKQCDKKEIIDAIFATAKNEKFYCTNVLNQLLEKSFPKNDELKRIPLTKREKEIAMLVASGLISKEIASKLNLSTHTIYTHRKNIMRKLKIGTTSELVLYAVKEGLV